MKQTLLATLPSAAFAAPAMAQTPAAAESDAGRGIAVVSVSKSF